MSIYKELEHRFTYHPPKEGQSAKYEQIRSKALDLAQLIVNLTPQSREQSLALTKLDEVVFFANAAIARNE